MDGDTKCKLWIKNGRMQCDTTPYKGTSIKYSYIPITVRHFLRYGGGGGAEKCRLASHPFGQLKSASLCSIPFCTFQEAGDLVSCRFKMTRKYNTKWKSVATPLAIQFIFISTTFCKMLSSAFRRKMFKLVRNKCLGIGYLC